jgi:pimeloyl-ACP methyl ester carboxylesterase
MRTFFLFGLLVLLMASSCKKPEDAALKLTETSVEVAGHSLATFSLIKNSKYLVVFESGLGDDHLVWTRANILSQISGDADILLYDRAGYGKSGKSTNTRDIATLSTELARVISTFSNGRKVILVGHSLGGYIIRNYAIKHPDQAAALLFVDTSHEKYNGVTTTQPMEDEIVNTFRKSNGDSFGGTQEAKQLIEDAQYMAGLSSLPDIPTIVLASMKTDAAHSQDDRKRWYDAQENLKSGVSDFTHLTTTHSGHYIMLDEPNLVFDNIKSLLQRLK